MKKLSSILIFLLSFLLSFAQQRTIADKTVNGETAVSVHERVISYDLIGSNSALQTYVAFYNADGEQIGEENHNITDVISSGTKTALIDALETQIGEDALTAKLIISTLTVSRIEYTMTSSPFWGIAEVDSDLITEFEDILPLMADAGGYSVDIDKTVQTIADQSRYNSFGNVFQLYPNQLMAPYRSGTDHIVNGQIRFIFYDVETHIWHDRETFITPGADEDYRDPKASVLGGEKIILFTARYKPSDNSFYDQGYFLSDALNTNDWGAYTALTPPTGVTRGLAHTAPIETTTPNTYYAAAYGANDALTNYKIWLWKIEYASGTPTFSRIDVYSGSSQYVEPALVYCGEDRWIIVARVNNRNQMVQFTSTDNGETWSSAADTDMGVSSSSEVCVPSLLYLNGNLICLYQDRETDYLRIAKVNPDDVFASALNWDPVNYEENHFLGYPYMCRMPGYTNRAMVLWAEEAAGPGSSSAIMYGREEDFSEY